MRQRMGAKGVNRMSSVGFGRLAGAAKWSGVWMCTATSVGWIESFCGGGDDDGENAEKARKEGGDSARKSCLREWLREGGSRVGVIDKVICWEEV